MLAYLKGYYGYKNFGDEMLLLWLLNRLGKNYDLDELVIEAGDPNWLDFWIKENTIFLDTIKEKIKTIPIKQHKFKSMTHVSNILSLSKYKNYFKFFGGGELLNSERKFPHNGRNLVLLYFRSIRKKQFALLGGIGKITNKSMRRLYRFLLPKAERIILREKYSHHTVEDFFEKNNINKEQIFLYEDFSLAILKKAKKLFKQQPVWGTAYHSFLEGVKDNITHKASRVINFIKTGKFDNTEEVSSTKYIVINVTHHLFDDTTKNKIKTFAEEHFDAKAYFFPGDTNDDPELYTDLQKLVPRLKYYDRTKVPLLESLHFLRHAKAWLAARLHILYPLKIFWVPFEAIIYKDKVRKLILEE